MFVGVDRFLNAGKQVIKLPERKEREQIAPPKLGQIIYIPTKDSDFHHVTGGWVIVVEIRGMVRTWEDRCCSYSWENLIGEKQDKLKAEFGQKRAHVGF